MSIGRTVRRALGPYEQRAASLYRNAFLDMDSLAQAVHPWVRGPRVLEVGCGDGLVAQVLTSREPHIHVTGIDVSPAPGQLYTGDPARAEFRSCTIDDLAATSPEPFDLVLVVDVLHHVDDESAPGLLATAATLVRPDGHLVVKEWERNRSPGYLAGWFSDRVISGERVRFFDRDGLVDLVERAAPGFVRADESRVKPRRSNLLVAWRNAAEPAAATAAPATTTTAPAASAEAPAATTDEGSTP
jgi:2-polyprenyl-6-hydroxyphenyl methylase/3-demethylubiquinone-9 3-methyltransferase